MTTTSLLPDVGIELREGYWSPASLGVEHRCRERGLSSPGSQIAR